MSVSTYVINCLYNKTHKLGLSGFRKCLFLASVQITITTYEARQLLLLSFVEHILQHMATDLFTLCKTKQLMCSQVCFVCTHLYKNLYPHQGYRICALL